jgi:hypothetical protein
MLHELKSEGQTVAIEDLEEQVNNSVIELFGIEKPQTFHK